METFDYSVQDDEESWDDSDNLSEWEEEKLEPNILCIKYNDLYINIHDTSNIIEIKIYELKNFFERFENIKFKNLKILIIYDSILQLTDIKVKGIDTIDEITDYNKLLLIKLEKILKKENYNLQELFIDKIIDIVYLYFTELLTNKCFICDKITNYRPYTNNQLISNICGSLLCLSNSFISDSFLLFNEINNNPERFKFMLYLFLYSCNINRIPNILPDNTNLEQVFKLFENINDINNLDKILTTKNNNLIVLLNWLIFNYNNIITLSKKSTETHIIFDINENNPEKNIYFSNIKDDKKKLNKYHGSSDYNYFNIIIGGLKNYSKTKHQTNGSVYGAGVYFGSKPTAISYNAKIIQKKPLDLNINNILLKYKYYNSKKILNCDIYYEDEKWANNNYCTVIPKNENIMLKTLNIYLS